LTASPLQEYSQRRAERATARARSARLDERIAMGRLAVVACMAIAAWLVITGAIPAWWLAGPVLAFVALAVWHDRVLREAERLTRAIAFYDHGLARIEDRWQGNGDPGIRFLDDQHIYARDLDIFGDASLFQLLSRARTHLGEDILAGWLKAPAAPDTLHLRQAAVAELRDRLDFRERLATSGGRSQEIDTAALVGWASAAPAMPTLWFRAAAVALAIAIIATLVWWARGGPVSPLLVVILVKMIFTRPSRSSVARIVRGVEAPLSRLDVLADTLALIEREPFHSARLVELRETIESHGVVPSAAIRRLKRLADMLEWRRNAIFAPISAAISWPLHMAAAIESWRGEFGPKVPAWLTTLAEHEALGSLAAYAYEHPADPFPEFVQDGPARFEGTGLGHPLVPASRMIRNDVSLTPQVRLLIVSGSNMSGKSTLLRTVGINAVLAMAGAPVRAEALTLTPVAVGATLSVHDSLQAGHSRFFAEISRIRRITDLTDRPPAPLFLLDELFQGTNSHDRKIGAEALLRSLIDRGAIGLTTTHDLALTAIADASVGRIVNVHFEDQLHDAELVFDYRMHAGPVTHSNALALMRAVGLPVSD
jgi:hypothetical protein